MPIVEPASYCKSCGAAILWLTTENGKQMPVDFKPEKRVVRYKRKLETQAEGELFPTESEVVVGKVVDTFMPHHATCPHADKHRRPA